MIKPIYLFCIIGLLCAPNVTAQTISGYFPNMAGQELRLEGFNGFGTYIITSNVASADGRFELSYSEENQGMGILKSPEGQSFVIILSGEDIELSGESFSMPGTITISKSSENLLFEQYASEHPRREQALSAWVFLENIYRKDSLFTVQKRPFQDILDEKERIRREDQDFLESLDPQSYVSWYLPVRKRVSSVSVVAQYRTDEIPETINFFRQLNYIDTHLYKSGLLQDVIDSHFWLIENSGRSLDLVFVEMNKSIDAMIESLTKDEIKFNEIFNYLFDLLERRSLFKSSEYLALSVLNNVNISIEPNLAKKLEIYRTMNIGNTAPDIDFGVNRITPGYDPEVTPTKLSDIDRPYTIVVFGASWCPRCREEIPEIAAKYSKWIEQGIEVVFVSLDDDEESFKRFAGNFPFISTADFKRWESPIVRDYHVVATPSMYLLGSNREILLHPNSVNHLDAWINWHLLEGNMY
jgi:thiol-disulfide isomerase/thioredoxin